MNKALRKLLVLALAIVLSASAIVGGTYAWFTDTVTSERNTIKSGNLDMIVEYKTKDMNSWAEVKKDTKLFADSTFWEPGHTEVVALRIKNNGSLAFKYQAAVKIFEETEGTNVYGDKFKLSDYLDVYNSAIVETGSLGAYEIDLCLANRNHLVASSQSGKIGFGANIVQAGANIAPHDYKLDPGASCEVALAITMPTSVENDANHNGIDVPSVTFGVEVLATQAVSESDSFGNTYDEDAKFDDPNVPNALVRPITGEDLTIECTDQFNGVNSLTFLSGEQTLDCGVVFKAIEDAEDLVGKEYADWTVDFEIESTKGIDASDTDTHIALAGYYDLSSWGIDLEGKWIGFDVQGVDVPENTRKRVMETYDANITYEQIVETVKEFKCGIILKDDYFEGETITLHLCVYKPDGSKIEIGEPFSYKVPV